MPASHKQSENAKRAQVLKHQMQQRDDLNAEEKADRAALRRHHEEQDAKDPERRHRHEPEARTRERVKDHNEITAKYKKRREALYERHRKELGNASA